LENPKSILLELKQFPNFARWKIISEGTTSLLGGSSNSKNNLNYKFRN
jgi:hypothetical protein